MSQVIRLDATGQVVGCRPTQAGSTPAGVSPQARLAESGRRACLRSRYLRVWGFKSLSGHSSRAKALMRLHRRHYDTTLSIACPAGGIWQTRPTQTRVPSGVRVQIPRRVHRCGCVSEPYRKWCGFDTQSASTPAWRNQADATVRGAVALRGVGVRLSQRARDVPHGVTDFGPSTR